MKKSIRSALLAVFLWPQAAITKGEILTAPTYFLVCLLPPGDVNETLQE